MIQYGIGRVADRHPPKVFAGVHVDRSYAAVWWLENVQPVGAADAKTTQYCIVGDGRASRFRDRCIPLGARRDDPGAAVLARTDVDNASGRVRSTRSIDVGAADVTGAPERALLAHIVVAMQWRLEQRAGLVVCQHLERALSEFRREVHQVVFCQTLLIVRGGLRRERLRF